MNRMKAVVFITAFLTVAVPGALWAQGPTGTGGNNEYAVLKLGSYFPQSGDMDGLNAKNGFTGQIGFGYYLNRHFALEVAVGYFESKGNAANTDRKFSFYPLEVMGKLGIPIGFVEPYAVLGVGGYYVKATAGNLEQTSTRAGFFGGGGLNFHLGETVFLGVEARYLVLRAPAPAPNQYSPSATTNLNLDGVIVTGNLGFRF